MSKHSINCTMFKKGRHMQILNEIELGIKELYIEISNASPGAEDII